MAARTTRNRQTVEKALQKARQHVAMGQRLIDKQRAMLVELDDHGHGTRAARTLLAQLEDAQAMHIAHRDRLIRELAQCDR
jgi:hypothetical protein